MTDTTVEPYKGMPATIHLYSDTFAAVVVRVNKKSITVARVATDNKPVRINNDGNPYPVMVEQGITTEVVGTLERYVRYDGHYGTTYRNGSISVSLGKSVRITDYRY